MEAAPAEVVRWEFPMIMEERWAAEVERGRPLQSILEEVYRRRLRQPRKVATGGLQWRRHIAQDMEEPLSRRMAYPEIFLRKCRSLWLHPAMLHSWRNSREWSATPTGSGRHQRTSICRSDQAVFLQGRAIIPTTVDHRLLLVMEHLPLVMVKRRLVEATEGRSRAASE